MASKARGLAKLLGIINTDTDTFDGRDVSADGAKLDGIEAGATADQTPSEIKTAYESNANTNAFTDAEQSKLAGIEAGATADQTITAGSGLTGGGTGNVTVSHADTSSQSSVNNTGNTFIQDVTLDGFGHVTGLASATVTSANNATITVSAGSGMTGGGAFTTNQSFNETVTLSHADTSSQGSVNNSGATVIQDVTVDTYGHVTGLGSKTITSADLGAAAYDTSTSSTGFFAFPAGTTAQRPASPAVGYARLNTSVSSLEFWNGSAWLKTNLVPSINSVTGSILSGRSNTLTLDLNNATDTIDVVFSVNGSEAARVSDVSVTSQSATVTVPSSVSSLASGTVVSVSMENGDATPSQNSINKSISAPPSGGTITSYDGWTVHTFTSSGTFSTGDFQGEIEYIVVAGGGGGGARGSRWAGGGGGGGLRSSIQGYNSGGGASAESRFNASSNTSYTVTVGAGGAGSGGGANAGSDGGASAFHTITTVGGGGGGGFSGRSGGSGGGGVNGNSNGAGGFADNGGAGTTGQGYRGGGSNDNGCGGGGGGAAERGVQGTAGDGMGYPIYSSSLTYFAGGGSTCNVGAQLGGGGGTNGTGQANTGGGGGAGFSTIGRNAGSGVVIIRYQG